MVTGPRTKRFFRQDVQLQVLLFILGWRHYFANFVRDNGPMDDNVGPGLYNGNNTRIMVTAKIGKHTVEYFDTIEELPIVRFHKYQKLLLIDAGVGSDIAAFDQRIERVRRFLAAAKPDNAQQELENLRQCVYMIQNGISPQHRAFAVLVTQKDSSVL